MSEVGSIRFLLNFVMKVCILKNWLSTVAKTWGVALADFVNFAPSGDEPSSHTPIDTFTILSLAHNFHFRRSVAS